MKKCSFPHGMFIRPDGLNELDPCEYDLTEIHRNVDVQVLKCRNCGHVEVEWIRREDTVDDVFDKV